MLAVYIIIYLLGCPAACRCQNGSTLNEGETVNINGICQYFCSKTIEGTRFCGNGKTYKDGDYIDCTSCKGILYSNAI